MLNNDKINIRYAKVSDKEFWFSLDAHFSEAEFDKKVRDKQGYVLSVCGQPIGILRYNLFWDNTPFCTLLYIDEKSRCRGYGTMLMRHWENDMKKLGFTLALVSTQSDETAQYFYRALGHTDCGYLIVPNQAAELFLRKNL